MDGEVLNMIREIIAEKERRLMEPAHALYSEIHSRLPSDGLIEHLKMLVASGAIEEHPTIREKSYTLKNDNQHHS